MKKLIDHIDTLKIIDNQRKGWMILSAVVAICVIVITVCWNNVQQYDIIWPVIISSLIVSSFWWWVTIKLIRLIILFKKEESEILIEIFTEIHSIKNTVLKNYKK